MIFGNKNKIAFVIGDKIDNTHIELSVFVNGINQHQLDNNHLLTMSVYNMEREIKFLENNNLTLKDEFSSKNINEIFDLFGYFDNCMYKSGVATKNIFGYDLSTSIAYFFAYQDGNDLIIFGVPHESKKLIYIKIDKTSYLKILNNLMYYLCTTYNIIFN